MRAVVRRLGRVPVWWMVALHVALLVAVDGAWIARDRQIGPPSDSEHHLGVAQGVARAMTLEGPAGAWRALRAMDTTWPPLGYLVHAVPAWLLGDEARLVRAYGLLLLPLLAWLVYALGRRMEGPRCGAVAAVLTLFSTGISGQVRQVSLDVPCTVVVLLGLLALMRTATFSRRRETLLFGVASGLCLLVRVQALFFLAAPALCEAGRALLRQRGRGRLVLLGDLAAAALLMALVSAPWWAGRLHYIAQDFLMHTDPDATPSLGGTPGLFPGLLYYGAVLGRVATWPVLLLALAGTALSARRKGLPAGAGLLLLAVAGGVLLNAVTVAREARYALPAIPALALLAAAGLARIAPRRGVPLAALLVAWVTGSTLFLSVVEAPSPARPFLEQAYVRRPVPRTVHGEAARWLQDTIPLPGDGRGCYLELRGPGPLNMRIAGNLTPRSPRLAWCVWEYSPFYFCREASYHRGCSFVVSTGPRLSLPRVAAARIAGGEITLRLYRGPPPRP